MLQIFFYVSIGSIFLYRFYSVVTSRNGLIHFAIADNLAVRGFKIEIQFPVFFTDYVCGMGGVQMDFSASLAVGT